MNPTGKGGFRKGQSGNPGGRPKAERTIQELARSYAPMAIATLVNIAKEGKSESARAAAANAILDRGYGRPSQAIDANVRSRPASEMTDDELAAIIASAEALPH